MPVRVPLLLALLVAALAVAPSASASAPGGADAAAKKPRGCAALPSAKARKQCAKLRRSGGYRKGQVCSLSASKQREYRRRGFFCIDVSANQDGSLTYLENL
jgi:hypothetical protein